MREGCQFRTGRTPLLYCTGAEFIRSFQGPRLFTVKRPKDHEKTEEPGHTRDTHAGRMGAHDECCNLLSSTRLLPLSAVRLPRAACPPQTSRLGTRAYPVKGHEARRKSLIHSLRGSTTPTTKTLCVASTSTRPRTMELRFALSLRLSLRPVISSKLPPPLLPLSST